MTKKLSFTFDLYLFEKKYYLWQNLYIRQIWQQTLYRVHFAFVEKIVPMKAEAKC